MPSTTSVRLPVSDRVMNNASELMSAASRDAAREVDVEIFWVYQGISDTEAEQARAVGVEDSKIVMSKQGKKKHYALHVMFFCASPRNPLPQCGDIGDIWISEPSIYVRTANEWTSAANAEKHPLFARHLTLHPVHFTLQWISQASARQNRTKWSVKALEQSSHPGVKDLVQRVDVREILKIPYQDLSPAHISRFLSIVLPCFLDSVSTMDNQGPASNQPIASTSIQDDHHIRDSGMTGPQASATDETHVVASIQGEHPDNVPLNIGEKVTNTSSDVQISLSGPSQDLHLNDEISHSSEQAHQQQEEKTPDSISGECIWMYEIKFPAYRLYSGQPHVDFHTQSDMLTHVPSGGQSEEGDL
ncbi:hypothetical protein BDY19DRAFT_999065 [Irpex rosettiformis]|uniref:Uncharacterized protein n=1 Tax=Irpex rosettiformis TaxID=378272 RepID=A0ACB8TLS4_9APHY|nr:hypothetical protein BDY19DRAFT_999065 [Irpex rosettiformis]